MIQLTKLLSLLFASGLIMATNAQASTPKVPLDQIVNQIKQEHNFPKKIDDSVTWLSLDHDLAAQKLIYRYQLTFQAGMDYLSENDVMKVNLLEKICQKPHSILLQHGVTLEYKYVNETNEMIRDFQIMQHDCEKGKDQ